MIGVSFGTRPEWNKLRPIVDLLSPDTYRLIWIKQHKDIVDSSVKNYRHETLDISDTYDISRLNHIYTEILSKLPELLNDLTCLVVQGDTTSAVASALTAFHARLPIAHVEAGLRTGNIYHPWPEEANRCMITSLASVHYAPTEQAAANISGGHGDVLVTGNTALDLLPPYEDIEIENLVVITLHRRENNVIYHEWLNAINEIAHKYPKRRFVFILHPSIDYDTVVSHLTKSNISIIAPVNHNRMINLLRRCMYVITDSGGLQEESAWFRKRSIVCRRYTERQEGLGSFSFLAKMPEQLVSLVDMVESKPTPIVNKPCPYGDGKASHRIVEDLKQRFL